MKTAINAANRAFSRMRRPDLPAGAVSAPPGGSLETSRAGVTLYARIGG
jgi:hypothetical protein